MNPKMVNDIVKDIHDQNQSAGWWNDPVTGEDLRTNPYVIVTKMMLVVSEVSEAVEAFRKDLMDDHLPHRSGVECELADAMIRLFDICGVMGLDIGGAIEEKNEYNKQRLDHRMENRIKKNGKKF